MSATITRPPTPRDPVEDGGGGGGGGDVCPWAPRHLPIVVWSVGILNWYKWRPWRCYLVKCWACELELGPYETWAMANLERQELESL